MMLEADTRVQGQLCRGRKDQPQDPHPTERGPCPPKATAALQCCLLHMQHGERPRSAMTFGCAAGWEVTGMSPGHSPPPQEPCGDNTHGVKTPHLSNWEAFMWDHRGAQRTIFQPLSPQTPSHVPGI